MILKFARLISGRGAFAKLGSDLIGRVLQYALLWVAARSLSQGDFGDYTFALSIGFMLAQVADFGLQMFVQRELSRLLSSGDEGGPRFTDQGAAGRLIGGGLLIKGVLSVVAMLLIVGVVFLEPVGNRGALITLGLAMVLGTGLDYFAYCFRALGKLRWEAWAAIVFRSINLALGVGLLATGWGVWGPAVSTVLATVVALGVSYKMLVRYVRPIWQVDMAFWRASVSQPTAVGIGVIFSIISFRVDNLLIPPMLGREALATYNVAYKLFEPSLIVPGVLLAASFPLLARAAHESRSKASEFRELLGQSTWTLTILGIVAAAALAVLSGPVVAVLYGSAYAGSAPVLAYLALACIPMYLNYGLTHTLIAIDKPKLYAIFTLASLFVNVAANMVLIPLLGIAGAAIATVATELSLLALCGFAVARYLTSLKAQNEPVIAITSPPAIRTSPSPDPEMPT